MTPHFTHKETEALIKIKPFASNQSECPARI